MRRITSILGLATLIVAGLAVAASAHHPTIEAEVACTPQNQLVVNYTSRSWTTDNKGGQAENSKIVIEVDGVEIGEGAYTPENNFEFSGTAPLPLDAAEPKDLQTGTGETVTVRAIAEGEWKLSPSETGNYREVTVKVPPCAPAEPEPGEPGGPGEPGEPEPEPEPGEPGGLRRLGEPAQRWFPTMGWGWLWTSARYF